LGKKLYVGNLPYTLDGQDFGGRKLRVSEANERRGPGGPGGPRGGGPRGGGGGFRDRDRDRY